MTTMMTMMTMMTTRDHGVEAEETFTDLTDCPENTTIHKYHFEAGEYLLEFMHGDEDSFNMVVLQMLGAHAHHHHDHGDDHDEHDDH